MSEESVIFYKGEIVLPKKLTQNPKELRHPAVVWEDQVTNGNDFTGIMLTKAPSKKFFDNILMKPQHFLDDFYNNTHFVNRRFIKLAGWGPFKKIGALSEKGIVFIEQNLSKKNLVSFDDYVEIDNL